MFLSTALLVALAVAPSPSSSEFSIDDSALFKINFRDTLKESLSKHGEADDITAEEGERRKVTMVSSNSERYECTLPKMADTSGSEDEGYTGPIALEILEQLFTTQACAYRLEHYWTYELCHGRYLRQYHEEREGKNVKLTEYTLGRYDSETLAKDIEQARKNAESSGLRRKPLKKKIDTLTLPYYELTMTDGTLCDLNGQPRITHVNYVCYPAGKHEIYSFKESSTCEYDIIVLSPTLCNHPDYRPEESNENEVDCRPLDDSTTPYKPRNLVQLEAESLKLRTLEDRYEGEFLQGDAGPGSVKIEIRPVMPGGGIGGDSITDEDVEDALDAQQNRPENWPERGPNNPQREPFKPLMDPEVVKEFLVGDYCLYGGSGWWKYEFCYGKKVEQYHQEGTERKTVISLGTFDKELHLQWLKENPSKRPKPLASRKHVSHFYSNGDICDVTQKPRQLEVKLKCKRSDSPSTVSLYLLEPRTCEYVLGIESPLVCDIIHLADNDGLMDFGRDDFDDAAREVSSGGQEGEMPVTIVPPPKTPPPSERQNPNPLKEAPPLKSALSYDEDDFDEDEDDDEDEDEGPDKHDD